MTGLVLHALLVATLLSVAAVLSERVLGALRLPTRWAWASALLLSVMLGTGIVAGPRMSGAPLPAAPAVMDAAGAGTGVSMGSAMAAGPRGTPLELAATLVRWPGTLAARVFEALPAPGPGVVVTLALAWGGTSLLLLALLLGGVLRHAVMRRTWPRTRIHGEVVRLSPGHAQAHGPAVVGLLHPEIILPRWVMELPAEELRLVLRHEVEHRRAGDTRLLAAAALIVALMPWNPLHWWQLRRLRDAVEMDCDARVLRFQARPRPYADLLLKVVTRSPEAPFPSRLSTPLPFPGLRPGTRGATTQLERRLHAMRPITVRPIPLAAASIGALLFAVSACVADRPTPTEVDASADAAPAVPALTVTENDADPAEAGAMTPSASAQPEVIELEGVAVTASGGSIRIAGDPPGSGDVRIRVRTATGGVAFDAADAEAGPLVIVDGVILARGSDGLRDLDPTDIERIEILKGAAAEARYGDRAGEGVLLVTTKAGAERRGGTP